MEIRMEALYTFLGSRNIPEENISKLRDDKIDVSIIELMDDRTLAVYIPAYGDRIAARKFCSEYQRKVLSEDPISFTITVTSDAGENGETVEATFKFTYVEKYPDEPPLWEVHSQENLENNDMDDILTLLQQQAEENLGMVMIFTLVTAVQEKLNEIVDLMKNRREEEKLRKEREAEEAEKVEFQGTVVTIENFLAWKANFELEMAEMWRKKQKEEEQSGKAKLTGKQLFETDHNLDTSDIQFLEDVGNSVEVDESLFQDIEDLDLEDDDPDFDPLEMGSDED
ncbi:RWD domain-containing protein 1 isoform X1 [Festucalex cinctus]